MQLERVLESEKFPYALGALQSRARLGIAEYSFVITDQEPWVINKVKSILEDTLKTQVYSSTVDYQRGNITKTKYRLVLWSTSLMGFLRRVTRNNSTIPGFVNQTEEHRRNYIRGFFDSMACVTYSPYTVSKSDFSLSYPRVIITKKNEGLLGRLVALLRNEGLEPTNEDGMLRLHKLGDMIRILDGGLFTSNSKAGRLRELVEELRDYQKLDGAEEIK